MKPTSKPKLAVGMRVRLSEAGPAYTVVKVTPCAAYIKGGASKAVTIGDRTFQAQGTEILPVSPNACVWREPQPEGVEPQGEAARGLPGDFKDPLDKPTESA